MTDLIWHSSVNSVQQCNVHVFHFNTYFDQFFETWFAFTFRNVLIFVANSHISLSHLWQTVKLLFDIVDLNMVQLMVNITNILIAALLHKKYLFKIQTPKRCVENTTKLCIKFWWNWLHMVLLSCKKTTFGQHDRSSFHDKRWTATTTSTRSCPMASVSLRIGIRTETFGKSFIILCNFAVFISTQL